MKKISFYLGLAFGLLSSSYGSGKKVTYLPFSSFNEFFNTAEPNSSIKDFIKVAKEEDEKKNTSLIAMESYYNQRCPTRFKPYILPSDLNYASNYININCPLTFSLFFFSEKKLSSFQELKITLTKHCKEVEFSEDIKKFFQHRLSKENKLSDEFLMSNVELIEMRKKLITILKDKFEDDVRESFFLQRLQQVTFLLKEFSKDFSDGKTSYIPIPFLSNFYLKNDPWSEEGHNSWSEESTPYSLFSLFGEFEEAIKNEEEDNNLGLIEKEIYLLEEKKEIMSHFFPIVQGLKSEDLTPEDLNSHINFFEEHRTLFSQEDNYTAYMFREVLDFLNKLQKKIQGQEKMQEENNKDIINDHEIAAFLDIFDHQISFEDSHLKMRLGLLKFKKKILERNEDVLKVINEEVNFFLTEAANFFIS